MIDFIEYVVAELKSKRLSKTNAAALVRQFSGRSSIPASASASAIHPLLHRNTSDLSEQRYSSTFTGEEFFLADHQVQVSGQTSRKVLPGVAYLEMARAAIEQAAAARPDSTLLELQHTVWAQPVVVSGPKTVNIALLAVDREQIDFEIYSEEDDQEIVHCQGRALFSPLSGPVVLDLQQLEEQMDQGAIEPGVVYAACAGMGLQYGPSFQGITAIRRGTGQLLAQLRMPDSVAQKAGDYVLHPSLMDGALQAAVALFEGDLAAGQPRLPFALESLRIISPCSAEMVAWVRYAPGSQAADPVVKLDVDLCDAQGNVCVQMRGVSSRVLSQKIVTAVQEPAAVEVQPAVASAIEPDTLAAKTEEYLRRQLSGLLKVPSHEIDPRAAMENYGIDSMLAMKLTTQLEKTFGSLPKTLFFEYQTIRALAEYFLDHHAPQLTALLVPAGHRRVEAAPPATQALTTDPAKLSSSRRSKRQRSAAPAVAAEAEPIAIIGLSGRYPEAEDLEAYWQNLRDGKDCIIEVPKERWDWREYFSDDRNESGHHYSKWGGFIAGVDEFDPLFFNMSPAEAELIDPQERLFLQHAWMAVEDAGYTRASLQLPHAQDLPGQVGVYVGLMYTEYQLFGAEAGARGKRLGIPTSAASIANRVSYSLNLHGPSMTLDTMCSSSLTAIHLACQDLKQGRTSLAIAGGVNVSIHPNKYLVLSAGQFISSDGHCQSFGEGGDGYIPGEGVGVVVLKRLSEAQRDGDHIYGVIRGSALNHSGKTNGYTVPNPQAQTVAIGRALTESHTDARHVSYIEAHGTGTRLGDPIEIAALTRAFHQYTQDAAFCRIGSAKSNIGHCESAAGVAGLTKVLLQMEHRQIVPSLHSTQLNPHIDFEATPFIVNQTLTPWEQPVIDGRTLPRIAGISSFGAGGSNAHVIVEEYPAPVRQPMAFANVVILLSARTPEQLQQKAHDLLRYVQSRPGTIDLAAMAYTLQVGREAMTERLGFIVSSVDDLLAKLQAFVAGEQGIEDSYRGQLKRNNETLTLFGNDADLLQTVDKWLTGGKLSKVLDLWARGLEVDWSKLYGPTTPPRISLPTYPFAKEHYWIDVTAGVPVAIQGAVNAVLHPLLHSNTSDLSEQRYTSTFTGDEFFLADHQVQANGQAAQKVLPGVAYLEMARAAIERALPARPEAAVLELHNTVWAQPIVVSGTRQVSIALLPNDRDEIDYEIYTQDTEPATVHCQGRAVLSRAAAPAALELAQLEAQMEQESWDAVRVYAQCARLGLVYGPALQGITRLHRGTGQLLAHLTLPKTVESTASAYVLHPSLLDGALQAAVGLLDSSPERSGRPRVPFALDSLRVVAPCTSEMVAWVRYATGSQAEDAVVRLDIDLCDARGNVCVEMRGVSSRALSIAAAQTTGTVLATPYWEAVGAEAPSQTQPADYAEHHVIVCGLPDVDVQQLASLLPRSQSLSFAADPSRTLAQYYSDVAVACFERIQSCIRSKPSGRVLVQLAVAGEGEEAVLAGLSGLLKTAAMESPQLTGQLLLVPPSTATEKLVRTLRTEMLHAPDALIKYEDGTRHVVRWRSVAVDAAKPPIAFRDSGVYLITGGLGNLGVLFAREILGQTGDARVILTGRSPLPAGRQSLLDELSPAGRVTYRQLDLGDLEQVTQLIASIRDEYGRLDGILHSAGMIADGFILKKESAAFAEVLAPKVTGTFNLDRATQDVELDFFALFSSIAGPMGNPGQADYSAANGFLDELAAYRNRQVAAKQRHGRTLSIDWPLWQAGGMAIDPATQEMLLRTTGMQPMQTAAGMDAFHRSIALPYDQVLVVEGELAKIHRALLGGPAPPAQPQVAPPVAAAGIDRESLAERTQDYLRKQLSGLLKLPSHKIDPYAALEEYGIDSILAMKLTNQLEKTFGSLSKTLFFEYRTIHELAEYFIAQHAAQLASLLGEPVAAQAEALPPSAQPVPAAPAKLLSSRRFSRTASAAAAPSTEDEPIAIIGLSGRYPEAENLEEYWQNLRDGKDCIVEVPKERWDWREYFSEDRSRGGHHYSKWGGFISGVDEFDPLFFNISPTEAELIDPQERLFLQHAWMAVEDAGYSRARLQVPSAQDLPGQVGVYAGVMYSEYQLFGAEAGAHGKRLGIPGSSASIANRVSYALNLHGPSMTLDTMCSSSLTAIHIACLELKLGRISMAIAGGVNVSIHPNKYLVLSAGQFISGDGHCQSFGEGGDGYIPGEGVGVVILKRLSEAERDGDHIYGVIRGSTLTHGGKTNGYTVPNPQAQTSAISRALTESHTDARHVSYIEAHGTGTKLGDPIEIAALSKAFQAYTPDTGYCLIGSAKSNIGHCESAAGIAGLTKVLLQMQHQQIVPSLHSAQLNPHIDFPVTPFVVNQTLRPWEPPVIDGRTLPRIAGISSFGAGGSNAHLIVEEYLPPVRQPAAPANVVILLSARTPEQLQQKARDLVGFVRPRLAAIDLAAMAYTLQTGRDAMEERLGFLVNSAAQLVEKLDAWLAGEQGIEEAYQGQVSHRNDALSLFNTDADLKQAVGKWIAGAKWTKLLELWVSGMELEWTKLYGESRPPRISLPTYPFAKERYWIDVAALDSVTANGPAVAVLHPLLHSNTSDLNEQRYSSTFTGDEFFLADHQVQAAGLASRKVLPGVAYLEMARAAIEHALPVDAEAPLLELHNVVWVEPIVVDGRTQISIALVADEHDEIDYEIYSENADRVIVHGQGRALRVRRPAPAPLDLVQLEGQMVQGRLEPGAVYDATARMGLLYGPSFQGIAGIRRGHDQLLAQLRLPKSVEQTSGDYVLHPALLDSALQACVGLIDGVSEGTVQPRLPFALDALRIVSPCVPDMLAWVRYASGSHADDPVVKVDVDLCDERGNVCVQLHGLSTRVMSRESSMFAAPAPAIGSLLATPVWQTAGAEPLGGADELEFAEHHVILCELANVDAEAVQAAVSGSRCLSLQGSAQKTIARRYSDAALASFERIRGLLQGKPEGKVLVQIAVADELFAGLSGLLKTAAMENPQFIGQLLIVPAGVTAEELSGYLRQEQTLGVDRVVRYEQGIRQVQRWQELASSPGAASNPFKDHGVYLITGGLGGLGILFAKEILARTSEARIILTGRSAPSAKTQATLDALGTVGRVTYRQVDLGDLDQVKRLIARILFEHHRLNGILHSAGMVADHFILKKSGAEFSQVLAPKVTGTFHLDQASQIVELDFFALFSSIAGALGNLGQADYAAANGFMDQFAAHRNRQVAAKQRHGRTLSINWPLWEAGGMGLDPASQELLQQTTGMLPMQTATGLEAFHRGLALPYGQLLVVEGDLAQLRRALTAGRPVAPAPSPIVVAAEQPVAAQTTSTGSGSLLDKTQDYLRQEFSGLLKLPAHKINPQAALEKYGIDSILAMKLTNQLEKTFGSLSKTLFFEYQTIAALAGYFLKAHPATVREAAGLTQEAPAAKTPATRTIDLKTVVHPRATAARRRKNRSTAAAPDRPQDIAIIGLAGRYPQAENLQQFWRNLQDGRDCITEIPAERWNHELYFDRDPNKAGKTYSKWGGFIADVDKFDPLFFSISPKEAATVDPQERLFLETAWETIEDAGYTKESISGSRVGVYVGVMWGQYELFGAESILRGQTTVTGSSHASVANRVSYFFDFHGPSIALDTMCSSSLTAIHLACEELRKGGIDAAIAGGVNLTVHPYKYVSLSQGRFVASDGRCRSFGEGGDGYVPGEGVGAVLLKPLDSALRDGDQVYAVIRSSSVNHGGKTNGYTVPNPNAQADLILEALRQGNIDPRTLSYVETHGTGTSLGDPIEITGLSKAFEGSTADKQFCPIGSVKSNIGHLESAAGIAAVTKALLQIRHEQLVPSLHAEPLNPNINFADSPFYVQTELAEWKKPDDHPRRVGVSSFGAGGSNAHLILEEYAVAREQESTPHATSPEAFVLSARDAGALTRYAEKILRFLTDGTAASLASIAYTSQIGRTPMDVRLAILASSVEELRGKLSAWIAGNAGELDGVFHGNAKEAPYGTGNLIEGEAGKAFLENLLVSRELEKLAQLWVLGVEIDWSPMYRQSSPRKVSLPTYAFAKERCWVNQETPGAVESTPRPVVSEARQNTRQRTYYTPHWTPETLPAPIDSHAADGPLLILDSSDDLFAAMKDQGDGSVVLVKPGTSFEQTAPNVYIIDPANRDHFRELVEQLESKALLPRAIVHHRAAVCNLENREAVAAQLDDGVFAVFHLYQALMERQPLPLKIVSVFSTDAGSTAPLGAAMGGFLRTLTLENPRHRAKSVEVQSDSVAERAGVIRNELLDADGSSQEIRYRGDARYVRRLVADVRPAAAQSPLPIRQHGVYLITGGLGGLGLIFAEYLAKSFQAKLVLVGRSAPKPAQDERLQQLEAHGAEVLTLQADVSKLEDMERVVREARLRFPAIHGVIHAAGVNRDAFLVRKTKDEMDAVLAPKVYGAIQLDLATRAEDLDWFVLFSSVAGAMGNPGQSDYAYGNRFLDAYAEQREQLRSRDLRSGRTLSIDWPLWEEGGMGISAEDAALLEKHTGLSPLPVAEGIRYWEDLLRAEGTQSVALYGVPSKIAAYVTQQPVKVRREEPAATPATDRAALVARTETYLKTLIGEEIKLDPDRIGSTDPLESFGIDSVMINRINANLERDLGAQPKTLLYEHETVRALATFLLQESREALTALFGVAAPVVEPPLPVIEAPEPVVQAAAPVAQAVVPVAEEADGLDGVAIIGIHGYYPHSASPEEYWDNLKEGRDLIDLVPPGRWDYEEFYHPDPDAAAEGKIYCKWGGFLDDYDKFDRKFFHISAAEAKAVDPQERLFLESVWAAIEDAGYTRESLKTRFPRTGSADVGVFVGVTTNSYNLWSPEERTRGNFVSPSAMPWSIANRVSYFFDFNGPSLPIDTACSSSSVAIHLACESLKSGDCQVAIAGGVNLYLHPAKYQSLCQRRMVSQDGKCHSYGAGDDGFVPGEAVGSLVLKPLRKAVADQDHIYAVIRATAFDHSGRSNGYSAPNPNSQASLISRTLEKAHIHPDTIGYVEGHGTGTQLGDGLEIAALTQAFRRQTDKKQFCPIGSVKANIGHSESAAGMAGVAKVLLQLEHRQLAPSIHSGERNPNIEFEDSPFYLQHGLSDWKSSPDHPRRALINSFGAGGVNACVLIEEYQAPAAAPSPLPGPYLFTLSAKNEERLREYADRLLAYLIGERSVDLAGLCYTFQVGREPMEERLATIVSGADELIDRLTQWSQRGSVAKIHRGSLGPRRGSRRLLKLAPNAGEQALTELASRWTAGEEVDWSTLYSGNPPRRISVPTYPFARERYWLSDALVRQKQTPSSTRLHPLIGYNSSTLKEVSFSSSLPDAEFYAVDHKIHDQPIFPGAGYLELACISGNIAGEQRVRRIRDIVWIQPLSFRTGAQELRTVLTQIAGDTVEFVISSLDDEHETVVHSEGRLSFGTGWTDPPAEAEERVSIQELKAQCTKPEDGPAYYRKFSEFGLHYGASFQTVQELYVNGTFALAKLKIADHLRSDFGQFILHPSMIDGALQTVAGLSGPLGATPHVPFALDEIDILKPVPQVCYAYAERADAHQNHAGVTKFNIQLLSESGEVLVRFKNLYVRPLPRPVAGSRSLAAATARPV